MTLLQAWCARIAIAFMLVSFGYAMPISRNNVSVLSLSQEQNDGESFKVLRMGIWCYPLKDGTALVIECIKDMPAKMAGVQEWDVIISINREELTKGNSLKKILQKYNTGDTIVLGIVRDKETLSISLQLGEQEKP
ncbi:MAG: PDZ domain-containing protein [Patescibacteria group bacterium]